MSFSKTTEGLIKASMQMSTQAIAARAQKRREANPKLTYEPGPHATHGKKYLSEKKRAHINELLATYKEAESDEERKLVLGLLQQEPIQLVPTKIETRVDRSKNTVERMQWLKRNVGGPKEQARAERRRKAMAEGVSYGAMDGRARGVDEVALAA